ncbi:MAG TPA: hypothetical protein VFQ54_11115 [Thermomicrobiales bacterium]|nr:hypothetical protein [Thermomicrobiales bacterium]
MYYWTDLYLHHDASNEQISRAIGDVFRVSPARIAIHPVMSEETDVAWARPDLYALVQRDDFLETEERDPIFPIKLMVIVRQDNPEIDDHEALVSITRALRQPVLSDNGDDGEDVWRLYWPDGTSTPVALDDDGRFDLKGTDLVRLESSQHVVA